MNMEGRPAGGEVTEPTVANLLALADFIETSEKFLFDMGRIHVATCDTAGCIAGFAGALWPDCRDDWGWHQKDIQDRLGLNERMFANLCYPGGCGFDPAIFDVEISDPDDVYPRITRAVAVRTLRELAETGEVHFRLQPLTAR